MEFCPRFKGKTHRTMSEACCYTNIELETDINKVLIEIVCVVYADND